MAFSAFSTSKIGKFTGEWEGAPKLRCDFQDFMQRGVRKRVVEGFVDVAEGHAVRQTFEDQFNGEAGTANGEFAAQQFRVRYNPLVLLIGPSPILPGVALMLDISPRIC
jgi:hypothetical protein